MMMKACQQAKEGKCISAKEGSCSHREDHEKNSGCICEGGFTNCANCEPIEEENGMEVVLKDVVIPEGYEPTGEFRKVDGCEFYLGKDGRMRMRDLATLSEDMHIILRKIVPPVQYRPMTHADVFDSLCGGSVVKDKLYGTISNIWTSSNRMEGYLICHDYRGLDTDVWEELQFKV